MLLLKNTNRMITRFFASLFVGMFLICGAVSAANAACGANEIDVLGDGTQCVNGKFAIKTTNLNADDEFKFTITAAGSERKLKVNFNNTMYSVYDDSVVLPNQ